MDDVIVVETDQLINTEQLAYELGGSPAFMRVTEVENGQFVVEMSGCDEGLFRETLDSHVAEPDWVNPDATPLTPAPTTAELREQVEAATSVAQVKAALLGVLDKLAETDDAIDDGD